MKGLRSNSAEIAYASRYESARALLNSGNVEGSQSAFADLYFAELESGAIPPFDSDLPGAFSKSDDIEEFHEIIRNAVEKSLASQRYENAVAIAWQCQETGHQDLADEVLERLEEAVPADRIAQVAVAALKVFGASENSARTTEVLGLLIRDGSAVDNPTLLRKAAEIAQTAGKKSLALDWLERALEIDYGSDQKGSMLRSVYLGLATTSEMLERSKSDPTLEEVRTDFSQLIGLFGESAAAMKTLEVSSPRVFSQRVVDAAEKWRSLDPDPSAACEQAAGVFTLLGEHELAWDYATTPLAFSPGDASAWKSLAAEFEDYGLEEQAKQAQGAAEAAEEAASP